MGYHDHRGHVAEKTTELHPESTSGKAPDSELNIQPLASALSAEEAPIARFHQAAKDAGVPSGNYGSSWSWPVKVAVSEGGFVVQRAGDAESKED